MQRKRVAIKSSKIVFDEAELLKRRFTEYRKKLKLSDVGIASVLVDVVRVR